jgi:hypothetical protein
MTSTLELAALVTVALIGAGGSYSFAANKTESKGSSSAPGASWH